VADTRFFVELAQDEYGNTAHGCRVVEGVVTIEPRGPLTNSPWLAVVAPEGHWLTGVWRWAETEGPARELSREEWTDLTERLEQFRG
jgi:hypothetical protein